MVNNFLRRCFPARLEASGNGHKIAFLVAASSLLLIELIIDVILATESKPALWVIAMFVAVLAGAAWFSPLAEFLYLALYLIFAFLPYTDGMAFPIFGVYFICVVWFIRHWTWPAVIALVVAESVALVQSDYSIPQIAGAAIGLVMVTSVGIALRILNDRLRSSESQLRTTREEAEAASQTIRRELATQLHDTVAKDLARVAITAENIAVSHPEIANELGPLVELAHSASKRIRPVIFNLNSLSNEVSLEEAIRSSTIMLTTRKIRLHTDAPEGIDAQLTRQASLAASLFVREAATNALKYATAGSEVDLFITVEPNSLSLTMRNEISKQGAATEITGGFGLANLEQRIREDGGSLSFTRNENDWIIFAAIPNESGENHE